MCEFDLQGYSQKFRLQRRLTEFLTICFFMFRILFKRKFVYFLLKSLNKPIKDYIGGRRLNHGIFILCEFYVVFTISSFESEICT